MTATRRRPGPIMLTADPASRMTARTAVRAPEPDEPPMVTTSLARATSGLRGVRHRRMPSSKPRYVLCGALQLVAYVVYSSLATVSGFCKTW